MEVLELLEKKQEALEMTDGEFADFLGISRPHWSLVRHRRRKVGPKVRILAAERWPKQRDFFLAYRNYRAG